MTDAGRGIPTEQSEQEDDVALKLLHTADWHLGLRFLNFDEADRPKLTRARLEVVRRILDLAEQYSVDAVLCAGDLFDDPDPDPQWWEGLLKLFGGRSWSGENHRPVFLLPGNHDPLTPKSIYASEHPFRRKLPDWVHVVDQDDYSFPLNEDAVLYAAPCRSRAGERDLAMSLPARAAGDERIRIGLVHGQTFDLPGCEMNFPIDKNAAVDRGLDYLAIGDTHAFRHVPPDATVPTVYPSAPEATNFGEQDTGFAALVFFRRCGRRALVQPEKVARWTWRKETVRDLASLRRLSETEDLKQTVLYLGVEMTVSMAEYDEVHSILRELKGTEASQGRVGVLQLETTGLQFDPTDAGGAFGELPDVLQEVVTRLEAQGAGGDAQASRTARQALYHLFRTLRSGDGLHVTGETAPGSRQL